jgi:hypothetical protein
MPSSQQMRAAILVLSFSEVKNRQRSELFFDTVIFASFAGLGLSIMKD